MTAPRAREQADPPSPPDRLPPRRGGRPSSQTVSAAARSAGFARLAGARRGFLRSARALAAAALLALSGGLALPATAQAQAEVLVSNIDENSRGANLITVKRGQGFTTGRSDASFPLTSIDVHFSNGPSSAETLTVTLTRADADDNPGDVHATLTPTASIGRGNNTFMAPAGTKLAAATKYFVVIETDGAGNQAATISWTSSAGQEGLPEWEVEHSQRNYSSSSWASADGFAYRIRVNGTVPPQTPPTPTAFNVRGDGNKLWLFVNENLSNILPSTSAFTLTAGGSPVTIGSISLLTNLRALELTDFSPLIAQSQTVTLDYTDPTGGNDINAIQDTNGNDASSFSNVVVNDSTVTVPKPTAAAVPADGATVALTFS